MTYQLSSGSYRSLDPDDSAPNNSTIYHAFLTLAFLLKHIRTVLRVITVTSYLFFTCSHGSLRAQVLKPCGNLDETAFKRPYISHLLNAEERVTVRSVSCVCSFPILQIHFRSETFVYGFTPLPLARVLLIIVPQDSNPIITTLKHVGPRL